MSLTGNENLNVGSKSNVYGRTLTNDWGQFFKNLIYRDALAVFERYPEIKNPKHLADALKIDVADALDRLECLENLGVIKKNPEGYVETNIGHLYKEPINEDYVERKMLQAEKLIQIAGKYRSSEKISDLNGVYCASDESIELFKKDILESIKKFKERNSKSNVEDRNNLVNFILGYTENTIKIESTSSEGL